MVAEIENDFRLLAAGHSPTPAYSKNKEVVLQEGKVTRAFHLVQLESMFQTELPLQQLGLLAKDDEKGKKKLRMKVKNPRDFHLGLEAVFEFFQKNPIGEVKDYKLPTLVKNVHDLLSPAQQEALFMWKDPLHMKERPSGRKIKEVGYKTFYEIEGEDEWLVVGENRLQLLLEQPSYWRGKKIALNTMTTHLGGYGKVPIFFDRAEGYRWEEAPDLERFSTRRAVIDFCVEEKWTPKDLPLEQIKRKKNGELIALHPYQDGPFDLKKLEEYAFKSSRGHYGVYRYLTRSLPLGKEPIEKLKQAAKNCIATLRLNYAHVDETLVEAAVRRQYKADGTIRIWSNLEDNVIKSYKAAMA